MSRRRQRPNDKWYQVNFLRGEWKVQILRSYVKAKNNRTLAIFIKAWELIEKWVKCEDETWTRLSNQCQSIWKWDQNEIEIWVENELFASRT